MRSIALLFLCACSSSPTEVADDAGVDVVAPLDAPVSTNDAGSDANSACVGHTPLVYDAPTDRNVNAQPTPPAIGPAGSIVKDPTYGTSLLRVTDDTSLSFLVANEFWGNDWSLDSKYFYFQTSTSGLAFRQFDPKTLTATPVTPAKTLTNGGFSRTLPGVYIGMTGFKVIAYDFATSTESTIVDLATIVPSPVGYALGTQEASNGLLVSAFGGWQQDRMQYVVTYDPKTKASHVVDVFASTLDGKALPTTIGSSTAGVHVFEVDPSGAWVSFMTATTPQLSVWAWNLAAGTVTAVPTINGNLNYGTLGWGSWLMHDGNAKDSFGFTRFDFTSLSGPGTEMISPLRTPNESGVAVSVAWSNAATAPNAPFIVESLRSPTNTNPWNAWDDEIIAVEQAPTAPRIWRFAHTFNTYTGPTASDDFYYLFIPRVSQDGQFVLFDSNWNASLGTNTKTNLPRTDMFIAALPSSCGP